MQPHKSARLWMKFLSIGCDNLCSAENDSFKTANNSSSAAAVKAWRSFDQEEREVEEDGGGSVFRAQAIYWRVDSWIKCYAATNDHMDFFLELNSTWFRPRGSRLVLQGEKAALSLVICFIFLQSWEG